MSELFDGSSSENSSSIPGRDAYDESARRQRLSWLRERSGVDLRAIDVAMPSAEQVRGNVEAFVGAVSLPLGLAGPLEFRGEHAQGRIVAPFATTEGSLVAATTRGARAVSESGGVETRVLARRMVRVPAFGFARTKDAARFAGLVTEQMPALHAITERSSRHAKLVELRPYVLGRDVHVALFYETGDAAGQNMTTLCSASICEHLAKVAREQKLALELCVVEGQMSGDKNLSFFGLVQGRGARVSAEAVLPEGVLGSVLKITSKQLMRAHQLGMAGALQAGVVGYNANIANVLAAMFAATGQDIACVHESALGILTLDASDGELHASLTLPSLVAGTVGGGTGLPAQQTCLRMLDCAGEGKAPRLLEIIAGFALALELSSYAAMVSGHFASAHARLGRKR